MAFIKLFNPADPKSLVELVKAIIKIADLDLLPII
jgi:hypothetical protein